MIVFKDIESLQISVIFSACDIVADKNTPHHLICQLQLCIGYMVSVSWHVFTVPKI